MCSSCVGKDTHVPFIDLFKHCSSGYLVNASTVFSQSDILQLVIDASVREHGIFLLLPHTVGIIGMKRGMNAAVGGWKGWGDFCVYVYMHHVCVCLHSAALRIIQEVRCLRVQYGLKVKRLTGASLLSVFCVFTHKR